MVPFQFSKSYASKLLQLAAIFKYRSSSPRCKPLISEYTYCDVRNVSSPGVSCPRPQRGSRKILIFSVKKLRPVIFSLLQARASVDIIFAIRCISFKLKLLYFWVKKTNAYLNNKSDRNNPF